jgi:hypothetical protein
MVLQDAGHSPRLPAWTNSISAAFDPGMDVKAWNMRASVMGIREDL